MKRAGLLIVGVLVLSASLFAQAAQPPQRRPATPAATKAAPAPAGMTNADVIKMVKAGLGEDVIIGSIQKASKRVFDLSTNGLIELKTAGVSDKLIVVMQNDGQVPPPAPPAPAAAPTPVATPAGPVTADDAKKPHEAGIYALTAGKLLMLETNVATSAGVGGKNMAASSLTFGIKKAKVKASVRGAKAQMRVGAATEFYFYGGGSSPFNPNEYVLASLESGADIREVVVGEGGALSARSGIPDEYQVKATVTRLDGGIYKVVPSKDLKPGEYAFFALGSSTNQKLWDFGVDQ